MHQSQIHNAKNYLRAVFNAFTRLPPPSVDAQLSAFDYLPNEDEGNFLKYGGFAYPFLDYLLRPMRDKLQPDIKGYDAINFVGEILADILGGRCDESLLPGFDPLKNAVGFRWVAEQIGIIFPSEFSDVPACDPEKAIAALGRLFDLLHFRDFDAILDDCERTRTNLLLHLRKQELAALVGDSTIGTKMFTWSELIHPCQ